MKFPKVNVWTLTVGTILVYIVFILVITYSNHFSTTITVKDKSNYGAGKYLQNIVMDTSGKVYTVHPMYLVGDFDAMSRYAALEVGKTYRVSGYGMTIPVLQKFPNITQISPA